MPCSRSPLRRWSPTGGWDRRPALFVGIVAGAFAAIPDIDVAYALVGLLEWHAADGALGASTAFWDASRVVHRSVTHSLVVGAIAAPAFGLLAVSGRTARVRALRTGAIGTLGALVAVALVWDGPLAALVMGLFAASGILVARWAARASPLSPSTVTLAALWGLWSHPWGTSLPAHPRIGSSRLAPRARVARRLAFGPNAALAGRVRDRTRRDRVRTRDDLPAHRSVAPRVRRPPGRGWRGVRRRRARGDAADPRGVLSLRLLHPRRRPALWRRSGYPSLAFPRATSRRLPSSDAVLERSLTALAAIAVALAAYAIVYPRRPDVTNDR